MGLKFTKEPACLEGQCLQEGLLKLLRYPERAETRKSAINCPLTTLEIQSRNWKTISKEHIDRWRTYGAMTIPHPDQRQFNVLMGKVTREKYIRNILLNGQPTDPKRPSKQELNIWNMRSAQIEKWIAQRDISLPMIKATQEEVKDKLKEIQQEDGRTDGIG